MKINRILVLLHLFFIATFSSQAQASQSVYEQGVQLAKTYQKQLPTKTISCLNSKAYEKLLELNYPQLKLKYPKETIALVLLLNGLQNTTNAKNSTAGIAQLPYLQARRYGLVVSHKVDERLLPDLALKALDAWYSEIKHSLKKDEAVRSFILKNTGQAPMKISNEMWADLLKFAASILESSTYNTSITSLSFDFPVDRKSLVEYGGQEFLQLNPHILGRILPQGQTIRVKEPLKAILIEHVVEYKVILEKPPVPAMDFVMHKVKAGETLSAIARQYGMTVQELKSLNNLRSDRINIDQKLQVKAPAVKQKPQKESHKIETKVVQNQDLSNKRKLIHEVMQGETLYSISKQYPGVSYEEIKVWNNLNDLIYPGQKIVIFVNK